MTMSVYGLHKQGGIISNFVTYYRHHNSHSRHHNTPKIC